MSEPGNIECPKCGFEFEINDSADILYEVLCPKCKNHWIKRHSVSRGEEVVCSAYGNSTQFCNIIYMKREHLKKGIEITLVDRDIIIVQCDCGSNILLWYRGHERLAPGIIALFYWCHNEENWWAWQMRHGKKGSVSFSV